MRGYAKKLGVSPAHLNQVLNKKKGLSVEMAAEVAEKLDLNDSETSYFCDLVLVQHARTETSRRLALTRLCTTKKAPAIHLIQLDLFKIISDWYYYAILELTFVKDFQSDIKWIAHRLGISVKETKIAIERLLRLDLLIVDDGVLKKSQTQIDTPKKMEVEAIKKANEQILSLARDAITNAAPEDRFFSNMTMAINKEKLSLAKDMMIKFKHKLCEGLEEGERDEVYCFSAQLFPLSQKKNEQELQ